MNDDGVDGAAHGRLTALLVLKEGSTEGPITCGQDLPSFPGVLPLGSSAHRPSMSTFVTAVSETLPPPTPARFSGQGYGQESPELGPSVPPPHYVAPPHRDGAGDPIFEKCWGPPFLTQWPQLLSPRSQGQLGFEDDRAWPLGEQDRRVWSLGTGRLELQCQLFNCSVVSDTL